jgi:large subunit ribosomal protein L29
MKIAEINEMPVVELQAKSRDLRLELFNLNLQKSMGTLEKSHRIGQIRKDIARVETVLTRIRNQPAQA